MDIDKVASDLVLGIFILSLSLVVWHATGSFLGWLVLFVSGVIYIFRGAYPIVREITDK
jgi:hypothetical protein